MKRLTYCTLVLISLITCNKSMSASLPQESCNKTCLSDIATLFLEAKLRGTLEGLPLSPELRATSNSDPLELGKGPTWQNGITIENRYTFLDPKTRNIIFFGTIAGQPIEDRQWWHYSVRISLDTSQKISEVEEQSAEIGFLSADKVETPFKESAIFSAVLPEDERVSEKELVNVADAYWQGLTNGKLDAPLFSPNCQRTEFGSYATNNPFGHDQRKVNFEQAAVGKSCDWFFDFAPKFQWNTVNRRYYIVDVPRGVVVGIAQLKQRGKEGIPGLTLTEAFKVVNGRIEFLWAPSFTWGVEESGWSDWKRP